MIKYVSSLAMLLCTIAVNAQQKTTLPITAKPVINKTTDITKTLATGGTSLQTTPTTSAVQENQNREAAAPRHHPPLLPSLTRIISWPLRK